MYNLNNKRNHFSYKIRSDYGGITRMQIYSRNICMTYMEIPSEW